MGGAGRVNDQRFAIPQVWRVSEYSRGFHHSFGCFVTALNIEAKHPAASFQILAGVLPGRVIVPTGVENGLHLWMRHQPVHQLFRVIAMAVHSDRQGLDSLNQIPSRLPGHPTSDCPKETPGHLNKVGHPAKLLREDPTVVKGIGGCDRREPPGPPFVPAAVDTPSAYGRAMPANVFRGAIDHQMSAEI